MIKKRNNGAWDFSYTRETLEGLRDLMFEVNFEELHDLLQRYGEPIADARLHEFCLSLDRVKALLAQ